MKFELNCVYETNILMFLLCMR